MKVDDARSTSPSTRAPDSVLTRLVPKNGMARPETSTCSVLTEISRPLTIRFSQSRRPKPCRQASRIAGDRDGNRRNPASLRKRPSSACRMPTSARALRLPSWGPPAQRWMNAPFSRRYRDGWQSSRSVLSSSSHFHATRWGGAEEPVARPLRRYLLGASSAANLKRAAGTRDAIIRMLSVARYCGSSRIAAMPRTAFRSPAASDVRVAPFKSGA